MAEQYFGYVRLYRDVDSEEKSIDEDLKKLSKFIKHRAEKIKNIEYCIVTYMDKKNIDGIIVVIGKDKEVVEREIDLILGFIDSSLTSIFGEKIGERYKNKIKNIPIPYKQNF